MNPDLFSSTESSAETNTPAGAKVLSVSQLNQTVARLLETQVPLCWISGEISNFTRATSGHWYFTLKDDGAQVRAVMFRGRAQYASFTPREGDKVEVRALVTLYAPRGDYQLNVEAIRRAGVGNLFEAFVQLKEKLARQGLFAPENKRPLPVFPRTVGIITSLQAAALRDVLTTFARRSPHLAIVLYPVPVQGAGAAEKIAQMLQTAASRNEVDLLLLCRGGGSIEDLWCFNEEIVARALAACPLPVITGIGHETDFTIADFVADVRAATPTAAAEMACGATSDWQGWLAHQAQQMQRSLRRLLDTRSQQLDYLSRRLPSPASLVQRERLRLAHLHSRLQHARQQQVQNARHTLQTLQSRLNACVPQVDKQRQRLHHLAQRQNLAVQQQQQQARQALLALQAQLELLNPQRTLERGYAIVSDVEGQVIRAADTLHAPARLHLRLAQGQAEIAVNEVQVLPTENS
ncbi:MAG: exodeoxyribonuclease VII large subunit [Burkholderiales bacterium]|nr:exodeoxyribonuclease VII large subunit [Burkholderiales bacterium]